MLNDGRCCKIILTFQSQKVVFTERRKGGTNDMTQADLILKLFEQLIAEKEKNNELQAKLEEYKKGKD